MRQFWRNQFMGESPEQRNRPGMNNGRTAGAAISVHKMIHMVEGFGNTFLVTTDEGNVVIDTSLPQFAHRHRQLLQEINSGSIRYIILTHGHIDHRGGVSVWNEPDTEILAQKKQTELLEYFSRFAGFFQGRSAAQFNLSGRSKDHHDRIPPATRLFDQHHTFSLGGVRFELLHTPGETEDHCTIWMPDIGATFVGDNFYNSFPNLYTLRGTKPRWAMDYVRSIDRILALEPEILLPSHGKPITGREEVKKSLERYRDAILYVHDKTVEGMNHGKDVYTLMGEIKLPDHLDVGESYGRVSWSVRGIFESYVGWFDGNPANMYHIPLKAILPELVGMGGGAQPVAKRALEYADTGKYVEALHLADAALSVEAGNPTALEAKRNALNKLLESSSNSNESGWLRRGLRDVEEGLQRTGGGEAAPPARRELPGQANVGMANPMGNQQEPGFWLRRLAERRRGKDLATGSPTSVAETAKGRFLFILCPMRSYSSVVCAMLGGHPAMYGMPELNLFHGGTLGELVGRHRRFRPFALHGMLRAIAQLHDGVQDDESVRRAEKWLNEQGDLSIGQVLTHLSELVAPRIVIDKSPSTVMQLDNLARMLQVCPDAHFLHLTRHPVTTCRSIDSFIRENHQSRGGKVAPDRVNAQEVWCRTHRNILAFSEKLPDGQYLRVKGEALLGDPHVELRKICEWLGVDATATSIDRMFQPELSPYATLGPAQARYGNDPNFLESPAFRSHVPDEPPLTKLVDREGTLPLQSGTIQLANQLGYR